MMCWRSRRLLILMAAYPLSRRSLSTPPELVDPSMMITSKALSEWKRLKEMIELGQATRPPNGDSIIQDTVGAIACTVDGDVSAGVSSGGILLKRSGRVGEVRVHFFIIAAEF
ncbi:hypothetical protein FRC09_020330 [Ceratobasidium sp. 395]|nr:hypothetical protein FRC09_020330 [Ceratobasidium sp. 395]